jgi:UDP-N-acetylmuramate: L-alanyl-gamma-D-glutamyl-meso-diaminopimelate ligase
MDFMNTPANRQVYLMGIGGIGMVNVAAMLCDAGWQVTGSDNAIYPPASDLLKRLPVTFKTPYSADNLPDKGLCIVCNALSRGHVEVEAALSKDLELFSFPEFLRLFLLSQKKRIIVAGTHGKTTTATCIAYLLERLGKNPSFLIGGEPKNFPLGGHYGQGVWAVLEGDEYDTAFFDKRSKFLHYFPDILTLGPIEFDHADIFASLDEIKKAFGLLLRLLPSNGLLVAFGDHPVTREIAETAPCRVVWVGTGENNDWQLLPGNENLHWRRKGRGEGEARFGLLGQHNRLNGLMGLATVVESGFEQGSTAEALAGFGGVRRRLEVLHESENLCVLDDFAHHPTAIAAAIEAVRERFPKRRLVAVFEPRSNTTVRNIFQREFTRAFSKADSIIVGSIHRAAQIPENQRLDIDLLGRTLSEAGHEFSHISNAEIPGWLLSQNLSEPTVILFMSNGMFSGVQARFVEGLELSIPAIS